MAQARDTAAQLARAHARAELLQCAATRPVASRARPRRDRSLPARSFGIGGGRGSGRYAPAVPRSPVSRSDIPSRRGISLAKPDPVIPDVTYTPAPLVPMLNPATGTPLDMSECTLRSVSPIHVQYLKNMNVAASMSVSIVVDGALWGLIAFHHETPKLVPYELREMCKHLGELLSQQVKAREDAEAHRQMLYLAARREKLSAMLSKASSIGQALLERPTRA